MYLRGLLLREERENRRGKEGGGKGKRRIWEGKGGEGWLPIGESGSDSDPNPEFMDPEIFKGCFIYYCDSYR